MSNSSDTKPQPKLPLKRWSFIQNDLMQAIDAWQKLEKTEFRLSHDEEQLIKIKTIISQLKEKLEQFN